MQRSAKKMRMGCTMRTAHSHLFLLAAADAALSWEIYMHWVMSQTNALEPCCFVV